jgi:CRP-like cAMP-binding protein
MATSAKVPHSLKKVNPKIPVFDVKLFLDSAGLGRKVAKFRRKETVFVQGDPAIQVMYIQEGGAKLTVVNKIGKEAVVAILGPGDFLGEGCLAGQTNYLVTATTISLARYGVPGHTHKALPKVSQEMLAEMVGTTRSRVNFFMNKFRKLGFIQYNGEIQVNDSLLTVVLHE